MALAYRRKWPNTWENVWFYMKNNLREREVIKDLIHTPIHPSFGYKRSTCYINFEAQDAIIAFNVVCILG